MSYSQADLNALKAAFASGVLSVEYAGRRTTFRSQADLSAAIATVEAELSPTTVRPRQAVTEYDPS